MVLGCSVVAKKMAVEIAFLGKEMAGEKMHLAGHLKKWGGGLLSDGSG